MKYPILTACALLLTGACGGEIEPNEEPVAGTHDHFRWIGDEHDHAAITANGLSFLSSDVRERLGEYNEDTDSGYWQYKSRYHVDNCRIEEGFDSVRERYEIVVEKLNPVSPHGINARAAFGSITHTIQDFYAHSNWVEAFDPLLPLFDSDSFDFPRVTTGSLIRGMMVLTDSLPSSFTISLPSDSRVPLVTPPGSTATIKGLITGTYEDNEDSSICPSEASIEHGGPLFQGDYETYLAKDDPDSSYHLVAVAGAEQQTTEEFCRLARLVLLRYGEPGLDALMYHFEASRSGYEAACPRDRGLVAAVITSAIW
ncbi:hypothetical protein [Sorangium cellulosum]|uniref:VWA7 N-terminal domain-containing protein n=1 Tax=Sorangium cellulosum TaxID=56 RepID=A0A150QX41_SORCE|nr:hypothetical protein [Sorangium cellulosum]KYF72579.1 hypothetical protein BE15_33840 [Sorangium cellulosum]